MLNYARRAWTLPVVVTGTSDTISTMQEEVPGRYPDVTVAPVRHVDGDNACCPDRSALRMEMSSSTTSGDEHKPGCLSRAGRCWHPMPACTRSCSDDPMNTRLRARNRPRCHHRSHGYDAVAVTGSPTKATAGSHAATHLERSRSVSDMDAVNALVLVGTDHHHVPRRRTPTGTPCRRST